MHSAYVKVVNKSGLDLPNYAKYGDAGLDLRASMNVIIAPGETTLVGTGLFIAIPLGYELQIRPRSGLSYKTKLRVPNAPGTIDANYRGEICIIVENTGGNAIVINRGDRIAQGVLSEVTRVCWEEVDSIDKLGETDRGDAGFGSTGV